MGWLSVVVWPAIPAFGRQKEEDQDFKPNLDYIVRPCLKKRKSKRKEINSGMVVGSCTAPLAHSLEK
jgi:hypothetical protein